MAKRRFLSFLNPLTLIRWGDKKQETFTDWVFEKPKSRTWVLLLVLGIGLLVLFVLLTFLAAIAGSDLGAAVSDIPLTPDEAPSGRTAILLIFGIVGFATFLAYHQFKK